MHTDLIFRWRILTYHKGSRALWRMHEEEETPDTIAFFAYKVVFLFENGKVFPFKVDRLCAWESVLSENGLVKSIAVTVSYWYFQLTHCCCPLVGVKLWLEPVRFVNSSDQRSPQKIRANGPDLLNAVLGHYWPKRRSVVKTVARPCECDIKVVTILLVSYGVGWCRDSVKLWCARAIVDNKQWMGGLVGIGRTSRRRCKGGKIGPE